MMRSFNLHSAEGRGPKDNFSRQSNDYAKYRPVYPEDLFEFILSKLNGREAAWDCGTGNGQTARRLAIDFENVFATDISEKQIAAAFATNNVYYSVQPSEKTNFREDQFDLVTISQALHWFRLEDFYKEVRRVVKSKGWIAAWCYSNPQISPGIDELLNVQYYKNLLGEYWDPERKFVDDNYRGIPFPFDEIKTPAFEIRVNWTIDQLEGYVQTWSALQHFINQNHYNPVPELINKIRPYWNSAVMPVIFPLHLRMGQVRK